MYKHIHTRTYTWSARNSNIIIHYFMANRKRSELFLDVRFYRVHDIGSYQYLTVAKLRFTPKWLHLPKNNARKETSLHYKISLFDGKVYDDYTNKEFNRNYKKLQKTAILFRNGGTSKL